MGSLIFNPKLKIYWLVPILLFVLQAVYTFNTLNQIRYEELEESVVNPYWVQNRVVQNGPSSNLGWHFLLVAVYNVFGFSLFGAKFVRLALFLISLFCLAAVLKKYLGERRAVVPLLTIGLSPTLLYFNTQQTVYGIDLVYLPIILFLATNLDFRKNQQKSLIISILLWLLAMVAWMSYPTFVYFLPALAVFYIYKLRQVFLKKKQLFILKNLLISFTAFFLPLLAAFLYITNRSLLIYDENVGSGMFRGFGFLRLDLVLFFQNIKTNLVNLFWRPSGYYYEIEKAEFSDFYPIVVLVFIGFAVYKLWKSKKALRLPIFLALSILIFNMVVAHFTFDPDPGMRRQTGSLAAIYIFFVFAWYYATAVVKVKTLKLMFLSVASLILLHHVIVYPVNLAHLADPSKFREQLWFKTVDNPRSMLVTYLQTVQSEDLKLACTDQAGNLLNCRYSELFAAVAASCYWNRLECRGIYGWDLKTGNFIPLTIELFNNYYFGRYGIEIIAT